MNIMKNPQIKNRKYEHYCGPFFMHMFGVKFNPIRTQ